MFSPLLVVVKVVPQHRGAWSRKLHEELSQNASKSSLAAHLNEKHCYDMHDLDAAETIDYAHTAHKYGEYDKAKHNVDALFPWVYVEPGRTHSAQGMDTQVEDEEEWCEKGDADSNSKLNWQRLMLTVGVR